MSECRLILGDCREVLPTLASGATDCVVTDPPFGKAFHDGGISGRPSEKWASPSKAKFAGRRIIGDDKPDVSAVPEIARILRPGGALYLFSQWMTEATWVDAIRAAGLTVRNRLIWAKPFHGAGDLQTTFGPQHESIIFATKGRHELRGPRDGDVWREPVGGDGCFRKGLQHPNQKPVSLISWLLLKSTDKGQTVADPYCGSGTTAVAAKKLGLNFIGCEIDPTYHSIAQRRIAAEVSKGNLFAGATA